MPVSAIFTAYSLYSILKEDLAHVTSMLNETSQTVQFKRDYYTAFGKIGVMLRKFGIEENPRNHTLGLYSVFKNSWFSSRR
jgi:predicted dinucleotide-utilizing enzyme